MLTHPTHEWLLPPRDLQCQPYIPPPECMVEQRVEGDIEQIRQQRVETPLTRITDAPAIMTTPNPMAPRRIKNTKQTHSCQTRNNIPGSISPITNTTDRCPVIRAPLSTPVAPPAQCSPFTPMPAKHTVQTHILQLRFVPIEEGLRNGNIISQEAINFFTKCVWANSPDIYTPTKLCPTSTPTATFNFQQVAMPMVHPKTGETNNSYK